MVLIDDLYHNTELPSLFWRVGSYQVLLGIHTICRAALVGFNKLEVNNLPRFLNLLESRSDYRTRTKGLLTVSNHISVLDDPLIWGSLPLSFAILHSHRNHRWSLASHDLCFTNTPLSHFFTLGQVLPTHRSKHSPHGGLFQPTFTEAVRLFSRIDSDLVSYNPFNRSIPGLYGPFNQHKPPSWPGSPIDPMSALGPYPPAYPSYPGDVRVYNAPSRYASNSYSWVHIFPEGFIHQTDPKERYMRYFKWGVSRLILEPPEAPDLVPMFIEGTDEIMHESRTFPRFLPRLGKKVVITYGNEVDVEARFGDLRKRWRDICDRENAKKLPDPKSHFLGRKGRTAPQISELDLQRMQKIALDQIYLAELGVVDEALKWDPEVVELRMECTKRVREEVLKVRRSRGYPDEDPKGGLAETWALEGPKREGRMEDGSWVKET